MFFYFILFSGFKLLQLLSSCLVHETSVQPLPSSSPRQKRKIKIKIKKKSRDDTYEWTNFASQLVGRVRINRVKTEDDMSCLHLPISSATWVDQQNTISSMVVTNIKVVMISVKL